MTDTQIPSTPSSMAPPWLSGVSFACDGQEVLEEHVARRLGLVVSADRLEHRGKDELSAPSRVFRATLPVKPSVTMTSTGEGMKSRPSTLPKKLSVDIPSRSWCVSLTSGVPLVDSSPMDSSPTVGRPDAVARRSTKVERHLGELHEHLGRCTRRSRRRRPARRACDRGWGSA